MGTDTTRQTGEAPASHPRANARLIDLVREFLDEIGEDPAREGLVATPRRVAEAWREFTSGYATDIDALLGGGIFEERHDGMVLVKGIEFYSICEHHLVPFFGTCHVAYLPDTRMVGLSKVARVVEAFARRLQVQERMTDDIARALEKHLRPHGVAVAVDARHLCMMMRGVGKHGSSAVTRALRGRFRSDASLVAEFYSQIGRPNGG